METDWRSLAAYNTFGIDARARHMWEPHDVDGLRAALATDPPAAKVILGRGSNVILTRQRYQDLGFVILGERLARIEIVGRSLRAQAGASVDAICERAADAGLAGLEDLYGLPGSIGGAVWMNAGAYGSEIFDRVATVRSLRRDDGELRERRTADIPHGYRRSAFQDWPEVVLEVELALAPGAPSAIRARMAEVANRRRAKQPLDLPNAGSVFKRPGPETYVGPMIEALGFKGHRVGGAAVSERHAGFIVNQGGATGADILALIGEIRAAVKAAYGCELECEQMRI